MLRIIIAMTLAVTLSACKTTQERITYPTASFVGGSGPVDIYAEVFRPEGAGPFPAVIIMHGAGGMREHHRSWARTVVSWGYVALVLDSFTPRGFGSIASNGFQVLPQTRVSDVLGAAEWLRQQPYVNKAKLGTLGFSHGGWTNMKVVRPDIHAKDYGIIGAVAYYPVCERGDTAVAIPLLILTGAKDDWTPADRCQQVADNRSLRGKEMLDLVIYPNAYHGFDENIKRTTVMGLHNGKVEPRVIAYDPEAAQESERRTKAFFDKIFSRAD